MRICAVIGAAGLMITGLVWLLPGNSTPKMHPEPPPVTTLARPEKFQEPPVALVTNDLEPQLLVANTPFSEADLASLVTKTVESAVEPAPMRQDRDLSQRGARLKAGRKLSELGAIYIRRRKFREAAIVLKQAIQAFPPETHDVTYGESLYHLGYSLRMSGNPAEAVAVLKLALDFPLYSSRVEKELKTASDQMKKSR